MLKSFQIILLLFFSVALHAQQEPVIKFYMNNGAYKKLNIKDIQDIGIIKSQVPTTMTIYNKIPSQNLIFDIHTLKQILFIDNSKIQLLLENNSYTYNLTDIDSMTIKSKPAPIITSINPQIGKTGDIITINGTNFGNINGIVLFNESEVSDFQNWNDTEITLKIPVEAFTGPLSVKANSQLSNEIEVTILPQINSINPTATYAGEEIAVLGSGFGKIQGSAFVSFNGIQASQYIKWQNSEIKVIVPDIITKGKLSVSIGQNKSNEIDYFIKPFISKIIPLAANIGDEINISGNGFGNQQNNSFISINGTKVVEYLSWQDNEVKCKIPEGTTSGKLSITVDALQSNETDFILIPHISELKPAAAKIGEEISINGIGFGNVRGSSFVSFANIPASEYTLWSPTLIKVKIPVNANTSNVTVTVNNYISNEILFTLIPTIIYKSVKIGNQIWMKSNLDIDHYQNGDEIPQVTNLAQWANLTTGAWCYYLNNENYGPYYGKLYNWYALNDPRGFAPEGWRIPTDYDWITLEKTIGMSKEEADKIGWRGTNEAGKLKEGGIDNWTSPNDGSSNSTGFTAYGGGYRNDDGYFNIYKDYGGWWSLSIYDNLTAISRTMKYSSYQIERMNYSKKCGFSIRCIKQ